MQHHSFFRNLPTLFICHGEKLTHIYDIPLKVTKFVTKGSKKKFAFLWGSEPLLQFPKKVLEKKWIVISSFFTDNDECDAFPFLCDTNAVCHNILGSYRCACQIGFFGNGQTCERKNVWIVREDSSFQTSRQTDRRNNCLTDWLANW